MNVLEKILEEIEEATFQEDAPIYIGDMEVDGYVRISRVKEIIRSNMDDCKTFEFDFAGVKSFDCPCGRHYVNTSSDGWIPVEERLPEIGQRVFVTVKHSSWIADFHSVWVSEEQKVHHPETCGTYIGYINENGIWIFVDEDGQENICDKEFLTDPGRLYDVATHWQPLPGPYKPKEVLAAGKEHIMNRFMKVE